MRQRILQKEKIFVRQNLNNRQINVKEIQKMITKSDKYLTDKIMRYKEGLEDLQQF